jgi:hypothetical protein
MLDVGIEGMVATGGRVFARSCYSGLVIRCSVLSEFKSTSVAEKYSMDNK